MAAPVNANVRGCELTHFYFEPPNFRIPRLRDLDARWSGIPDREVRSMIVVENQYLEFHLFALHSLSFRWEKRNGFITGRIDHSVSAGAVKAALLLQASIAEAAMRAHAESRNYRLPNNSRHRTFGKVCAAWEEANYAELHPVWADVQSLKDQRNLVHLYLGAEQANDYRELLHAENDLVAAGQRVLERLCQITST